MKTTLELPDTLFREAKQRAAAEGVAFREIVTRALHGYLQHMRRGAYRFDWRTDQRAWNAALPLHDRRELEAYLGTWRSDLYG